MASNEIIFDGDKTLNELVDELMIFHDDFDDELTAICHLEGKNLGFELRVTLRKSDEFDA